MGLLDLFKPSASTTARVDIQFPDDFEMSLKVSIRIEGAIPNGTEIWVWDLYYAKTLFNLGHCEAADGLKSQLEAWAEDRVTILIVNIFNYWTLGRRV